MAYVNELTKAQARRVAEAANEKASVRRKLEQAARHYARFSDALDEAAMMAGEDLRSELVSEAYRNFDKILPELNFNIWANAYGRRRR